MKCCEICLLINPYSGWVRIGTVLVMTLLVIWSKLEMMKYLKFEFETIRQEIKLGHLFPYNPSLPTNYTPLALPDLEWHSNYTKHKMGKFVYNYFKKKTNGFFIECGAVDGVFLSNTLKLERDYHWTGLLVEADPNMSPILKKRNRRAWVSGVCLSTKPYPITTEFKIFGTGYGYIPNTIVYEDPADHDRMKGVNMTCLPLAMLLDAIGVDEVDYLSLDVEGVEIDILKTIPWDKIRIKLISLESFKKNQKDQQTYMESIGYRKITRQDVWEDLQHDDVYEFHKKPSSYN